MRLLLCALLPLSLWLCDVHAVGSLRVALHAQVAPTPAKVVGSVITTDGAILYHLYTPYPFPLSSLIISPLL